MAKLITVERAKEEVRRLQHYIELVESYEPDSVEQQIIKEYAITNSLEKVANNLHLNREFVTNVIKGRGSDELHRLMRSGYMYKTRANRNR